MHSRTYRTELESRKEHAMTGRSWMQGPPRKILVATDLSARCDRAFDRAATLATAWNAQLVAVHVMAEGGIASDAPPIPSWRRPPDSRELAEARARAEIREQAPNATVAIFSGDPADAIVRAAETHGCDLIVTGVARYEPLGRLVLGSTVERLVRRSRLPLLIVRKRGRQAYRHVVAATDFSEASRHALEAAVRFFPLARLTLFHAYDVPMRMLVSDPAGHTQQFKDLAAASSIEFLKQTDLKGWPGGKPEVLLEDGEPDRLLHDYARDKDIDLVALGSHGHSALFDVLLGSVAQRLLGLLPCDVLLVREPRAAVAA
jgi:nucleotide-binding universal stress UspA family protein